RAESEPGEIESDDPMTVRQKGNVLQPIAPATAEAVYQQDRWTLTLVDVTNRRFPQRRGDRHAPDAFGPIDLQPAPVGNSVVIMDGRGRGSLGQETVIL